MKKTALITGGSSGLGFALAEAFIQRGYEIILLARDLSRLEAARDRLNHEGVSIFPCDVADAGAVGQVYDQIRSRSIDFLVLNAGIVQTKLMGEYKDPQALKAVIDIDLWGCILCANIFLPLIPQGGRILMVSSGFGLMGPAGYATYAAAKAGMINFAQSLRRELLHRKITVSVTCPGDMDTPQLQDEFENMPEWMRGSQTAPRGMMSPQKAARLILKKCFKGRFLVIINFELTALLFLQRLLPRPLLDFIIDRMFPLPPSR